MMWWFSQAPGDWWHPGNLQPPSRATSAARSDADTAGSAAVAPRIWSPSAKIVRDCASHASRCAAAEVSSTGPLADRNASHRRPRDRPVDEPLPQGGHVPQPLHRVRQHALVGDGAGREGAQPRARRQALVGDDAAVRHAREDFDDGGGQPVGGGQYGAGGGYAHPVGFGGAHASDESLRGGREILHGITGGLSVFIAGFCDVLHDSNIRSIDLGGKSKPLRPGENRRWSGLPERASTFMDPASG
jgi:hypothetical protein